MTLRPDDLLTLPLPASPTLHPDGRTVVVAVHTPSADGTAISSRLELRSGSDRGPFAAPDTGDDARPAYSPDGTRVAFLSTRTGKRRVHVVTADGADVATLDTLPASVSNFAWLGDSTLVALVERPGPKDPTGTRIDWLRYKADGRRGWLTSTGEFWITDLAGSSRKIASTPDPVPAWTACGRRIHYVVEKARQDEPFALFELRTLDVDDGTDELWWQHRSPIFTLTTTRRSSHLVAVSSADPCDSTAPPVPWLVTPGGARHLLDDPEIDCDRSITGDARPPGPLTRLRPVDGTDELLVLDTTGPDVALWLTDVTTGSRRRLSPEGMSVTDFSGSYDRVAAVCLESAVRPTELHLVSLDGSAAPSVRTGPTSSWLADHPFVAPETIDAVSSDGLPVPSLLYRTGPGPRPLVVRLHGGPHLSLGHAFDVETQLLVAAGFSLLAPSMRGSSGRGRAVRSASVGEWGGRDVDDVLAATYRAVEIGAADPDRLYVTGGSYGGFLVNTLLTRTDRFRAAVSDRSISNWLSKYGTSDNGFTHNLMEFGGADVLGDVTTLWERSPLSAVHEITTPLLLVHGEDDHRVPIEQSEQLFVALRRLGRECVFLRVPGESHDLTIAGRHDRRVRRLTEVVSWFDTHDARVRS